MPRIGYSTSLSFWRQTIKKLRCLACVCPVYCAPMHLPGPHHHLEGNPYNAWGVWSMCALHIVPYYISVAHIIIMKAVNTKAEVSGVCMPSILRPNASPWPTSSSWRQSVQYLMCLVCVWAAWCAPLYLPCLHHHLEGNQYNSWEAWSVYGLTWRYSRTHDAIWLLLFNWHNSNWIVVLMWCAAAGGSMIKADAVSLYKQVCIWPVGYMNPWLLL